MESRCEYFPILKTGVRIFRPCEIKALVQAIPKVDNKDKFEALLYTGCRYSEMRWLYKHQDAFKGDTILMPAFKPMARHKERYIRLNMNGRRAVTYFLRSKRNLPPYNGWDMNLKRWCGVAGIDTKGVSVKSTRKTWESWLTTMYPSNFQNVFLSQGHTQAIALEYYLMLPFSDQDKEDMKFYTDGWI